MQAAAGTPSGPVSSVYAMGIVGGSPKLASAFERAGGDQ